MTERNDLEAAKTWIADLEGRLTKGRRIRCRLKPLKHVGRVAAE
jgi:hypothetical protein